MNKESQIDIGLFATDSLGDFFRQSTCRSASTSLSLMNVAKGSSAEYLVEKLAWIELSKLASLFTVGKSQSIKSKSLRAVNYPRATMGSITSLPLLPP